QGRRAEDGPIPPHYPLEETPWDGYPQRTDWNVRDSDGTLILMRGQVDRGTALTEQLARKKNKPFLVVDLDLSWDVAAVQGWIEQNHIRRLNVAGRRESSTPGIGEDARRFLRQLLGREGEVCSLS